MKNIKKYINFFFWNGEERKINFSSGGEASSISRQNPPIF